MAFVEICFPEAGDELLIATAYFSVRGYDLARTYIPDPTRIHVLVGKRDGPRVQDAVMEEIKRELREVEHQRLYAAVEDLLDRLRSGRFRIADARQMAKPFHCKFYISHALLAWHGSANFSTSGLKGQSEQAQIVRDPVQIQHWTNWFHEVAATARDLHEELVKVLEDWLRMADPFDVYLKALLHLLDLPDLRRERGALHPVYYQRHLAAWALRQLDAYGGALLVVATGLGKTIIGAEIAGLLRATDEVDCVVLLAPRTVYSLWKTQLHGRGVPFEAFDNSVLFKDKTGEKHHQVSQLVALLHEADTRTLILVDEAHIYRNQLLAHGSDHGSRVVDRIARAVNQGARIVLMTGSAYGTSVQNLDSLLYLLPHRNHETLEGRGPWKAGSYQRFNTLPPVAVLGYPHVLKMARQRGDVEDGHPYIDFGTERHYLPKTLQSQLVAYDLPLEKEVAAAFEAGCFDQARKIPTLGFSDEEGKITTMTDTVYNVTLEAWLSSPHALQACIAENLSTKGLPKAPQLLEDKPDETPPKGQKDLWGQVVPDQRQKARGSGSASGYKITLHLDVASRRPLLESLQYNLKILSNTPDDKARKLIELLRQHRKAGSLKAIVFVERLVTARYLKRVLHYQMRALRVACTVAPSGKLEPPSKRTSLLERFSPRSHNQSEDGRSFNMLLCTDADGIGVNLQDADIVINYDLTAGADRLVQRLGRVLRATPERERTLYVYTFLPSLLRHSKPDGGVYRRIRERYARLFARHEKSSKILGSRILARDGHTTTVDLEGEVDVASLFSVGDRLAAADWNGSLAGHLSVLEEYRQRAEVLPHTLHSSRHYSGSEPRLVVLIRHHERHYPLVVEPESQRVVSEDALAALNLLACPPDAPRADVLLITVPQILDAAEEAVRQWCTRHDAALGDVERIAALYLLPKVSARTTST